MNANTIIMKIGLLFFLSFLFSACISPLESSDSINNVDQNPTLAKDGADGFDEAELLSPGLQKKGNHKKGHKKKCHNKRHHKKKCNNKKHHKKHHNKKPGEEINDSTDTVGEEVPVPVEEVTADEIITAVKEIAVAEDPPVRKLPLITENPVVKVDQVAEDKSTTDSYCQDLLNQIKVLDSNDKNLLVLKASYDEICAEKPNQDLTKPLPGRPLL